MANQTFSSASPSWLVLKSLTLKSHKEVVKQKHKWAGQNLWNLNMAIPAVKQSIKACNNLGIKLLTSHKASLFSHQGFPGTVAFVKVKTSLLFCHLSF